MSAISATRPVRQDSSDSPFWILPSWVASLAVHALLMIVFATSLRSCSGGGIPGAKEGEFREIGLHIMNDAAENDSDAASEAASSDSPTEAAETPTQTSGTTDVPEIDAPPVELPSTSEANPVLGAGSGPPVSLPGDVREPIRSNAVAGPSGLAAAGIGLGASEFFGIKDKATRVVYVIDCSGSMADNSAIRVAKAELIASLRGLEKTQQFQIVFYNQSPRELNLDGSRQASFYFATDINRTLAGQFIDSVQPALGTDHMPALKLALRFNPEVVYFLTDAAEPRLYPRDLSEIKRMNNGRARIHCVEFGKGPELPNLDNFLKQLARQNGGSFRYRDVTRFEKR